MYGTSPGKFFNRKFDIFKSGVTEDGEGGYEDDDAESSVDEWGRLSLITSYSGGHKEILTDIREKYRVDYVFFARPGTVVEENDKISKSDESKKYKVGPKMIPSGGRFAVFPAERIETDEK